MNVTGPDLHGSLYTHVGATRAANEPAVQSTALVPEYSEAEHVKVQLAPLATLLLTQSVVYALLPEPPLAMVPVQEPAGTLQRQG